MNRVPEFFLSLHYIPSLQQHLLGHPKYRRVVFGFQWHQLSLNRHLNLKWLQICPLFSASTLKAWNIISPILSLKSGMSGWFCFSLSRALIIAAANTVNVLIFKDLLWLTERPSSVSEKWLKISFLVWKEHESS